MKLTIGKRTFEENGHRNKFHLEGNILTLRNAVFSETRHPFNGDKDYYKVPEAYKNQVIRKLTEHKRTVKIDDNN